MKQLYREREFDETRKVQLTLNTDEAIDEILNDNLNFSYILENLKINCNDEITKKYIQLQENRIQLEIDYIVNIHTHECSPNEFFYEYEKPYRQRQEKIKAEIEQLERASNEMGE